MLEENNPDSEPNEPAEPELTQESLQAKLQDYHKALASEFEIANKTGDNDKASEATVDFFRKHVPLAAAQIVHLAQFSTSDATRANCSKYIIEYVDKAAAGSPGDPLDQLLKQLSKQPAETNTNSDC